MDFTYTYQIDVYASGHGCEKIGEATGTVQATRYSHACVKAWPLINEQCAVISATTGHQTSVGPINVRMVVESAGV